MTAQAVQHAVTLLSVIALAMAYLGQCRETERAWCEVGAWRAHHIATVRAQYAWFVERWRRVHGTPPPPVRYDYGTGPSLAEARAASYMR